MQDYIFNSRKKAARKRRRSIIRLLLLIIIVLAAALGAKLFFTPHQSDNQPAATKDESLTLPPAENTQNVPAPSADTGSSQEIDTDIPPLPEAVEPAPELAQPAPSEPISKETASEGYEIRWVEHKVKSGESLAKIFQKQDLKPALLHKIVNSDKKAKNLANIKPGETIRFGIDDEGQLQKLILQRDKINSLHITGDGENYQAEELNRDVESRLATANGVIESSLFVDGQKPDDHGRK